MPFGIRPSPRWRSGSSDTRAMPATPSAAICAAICGTPISPSGVWPPVMATAPLTRILKVMVALAATAARTARLPEWV